MIQYRLLLTILLCALGWRSSIADEPARTDWKYEPRLLRPFWQGETVEGESVLFIRDDATGEARASVLFPIAEVLTVRNSAGNETYEEGRDFVWKPGSREIVLPAGSRIVAKTPQELRRPAKSQKYELTHRDGNGEIFFGGELEYHAMQTCITYRHAPNQWSGPVPTFDAAALPKTIERLRGRQPLSIVLLGDSISTGCNASGWANGVPFQPAYPELLRQHLEASYGGKVTLTNLSVGGTSTPWGITMVDKVVEYQPNLVILAFGMNDSAGRSAEEYKANTQAMIDKIHEAIPECEFILVASMLGNRDWIRLKHEVFPQYRDALASLCEPGIALADMTSIWTEFLERKLDWDLTGNGVNHPNDFGHRVYAQVLSTLLVPGSNKPNVVVILSDDQGWGDLSLNGNTNLSTPNIDSLAREGASFDRFYVCPVCSPTRAEFLTGRYHPRSGVYSTSSGGERMNLDEMTIADTFKAAGYATGAFGKWHNGMQYPYHPNGRGFDEYYGFCSGHWGDYFSPPLEHNGQLVQGDGFIIDDLTNKAMAFMESNKDKPFFAYLPYNTPHSPMQVPDPFWDKFKDKELAMHNREAEREDIGHTRCALAMCENIDWNVGRILEKLVALGIEDNTIVIYFCDNGPNGVRWNGGMKGRKGSTDEGGVRSPLLIRWPGHITGGTKISPIAAAIDLLPTLADLCEIKVASQKQLDGTSLKPLFSQNALPWPDRTIFSHWNKKISVRTQQYRLDHQGKLFDMYADPGQDKDISQQNPELTRKLVAAQSKYQKEVLAGYDNDTRPFLVGHADYRYTQIPARDGTAHGSIKRSNRFPNCSFFTNWTSVDDKITWDAEVGATGDYEVELYYACPQADVGSTVELRFDNSKLVGRITQAHDPPLRGGEHDRVERQESYVKDFKSMPLGRIHLEKGKGTLTLQATEMPGKQVMEFRLLMLTRVSDG